MAHKVGTDQHHLLHERWPNDCCLCRLEDDIRNIRTHVSEMVEYLKERKEYLHWQILTRAPKITLESLPYKYRLYDEYDRVKKMLEEWKEYSND